MELLKFDSSNRLFGPIDLICKQNKEFFLVFFSVITSTLRKIVKTGVRILTFVLALFRMILTLFASVDARDWFIQQARHLAADLADWLIWPFGLINCLTRSLFRTLFN